MLGVTGSTGATSEDHFLVNLNKTDIKTCSRASATGSPRGAIASRTQVQVTYSSHWEIKCRRTRSIRVGGCRYEDNIKSQPYCAQFQSLKQSFLLERVTPLISVQIAILAVQHPGPARPAFHWTWHCEMDLETRVFCPVSCVSASKKTPQQGPSWSWPCWNPSNRECLPWRAL